MGARFDLQVALKLTHGVEVSTFTLQGLGLRRRMSPQHNSVVFAVHCPHPIYQFVKYDQSLIWPKCDKGPNRRLLLLPVVKHCTEQLSNWSVWYHYDWASATTRFLL